MKPNYFFAMAVLTAPFAVTSIAVAADNPAEAGSPVVSAPKTIQVLPTTEAVSIDGNYDDWDNVPGQTLALTGQGGASEILIKFARQNDEVVVYAEWEDSSANLQHKPYKWDEETSLYRKHDIMEDRFAASFAMSGDFSMNKIDGSEFEADVWHWKAARSNPIGLAHDKMWRITKDPESKGVRYRHDNGVVFVERISDEGDRLYRPSKPKDFVSDIMSRYKLNPGAEGSIADVAARGEHDGSKWRLELSRKMDTGHADDRTFKDNESVEVAIAVFDGVSMNRVDGGNHSVSETFLLHFVGPES